MPTRFSRMHILEDRAVKVISEEIGQSGLPCSHFYVVVVGGMVSCQTNIWFSTTSSRDIKHSRHIILKATPAAPPISPPHAFLLCRRPKIGPVASPGARFSPACVKIGAGGPRPNPGRWGVPRGAGASGFGAKAPRARRVSGTH